MRESKAKARALVFGQFLLLLLLVINPFDPQFSAERIFSLTLYAIATVILASAAVALGSALTASPIPKDDAELVTRGIYRWIRHPMYTALILIGSGLMIADLNPFSALVLLALVALLVTKSRYEDALLLKKHPGAKSYQAATGRFLPKF